MKYRINLNSYDYLAYFLQRKEAEFRKRSMAMPLELEEAIAELEAAHDHSLINEGYQEVEFSDSSRKAIFRALEGESVFRFVNRDLVRLIEELESPIR